MFVHKVTPPQQQPTGAVGLEVVIVCETLQLPPPCHTLNLVIFDQQGLVQSKFSFELNLHNLENAERELRVRFGNSPNSNAEPRSAFDHAKFGSKRRSERRTRYIGVRHSEHRFEPNFAWSNAERGSAFEFGKFPNRTRSSRSAFSKLCKFSSKLNLLCTSILCTLFF